MKLCLENIGVVQEAGPVCSNGKVDTKMT